MEEDTKLVETDIRDRIVATAQELYDAKCKLIGPENQKQLEKGVMLQTIDMLWKEHLAAMDYMRLGIGLQGYAQRNPKNEYKIQSFNLFTKLLDNIKYQVIKMLSRVQIQMRNPEEERKLAEERARIQAMAQQALMQRMKQAELNNTLGHAKPDTEGLTPEEIKERAAIAEEVMRPTVGRNDPCPCGSGKKYKDCCGKTKD